MTGHYILCDMSYTLTFEFLKKSVHYSAPQFQVYSRPGHICGSQKSITVLQCFTEKLISCRLENRLPA